MLLTLTVDFVTFICVNITYLLFWSYYDQGRPGKGSSGLMDKCQCSNIHSLEIRQRTIYYASIVNNSLNTDRNSSFLEKYACAIFGKSWHKRSKVG